MQVRCPSSGQLIPAEHINVQADIVLSPFTGEIHKLSDLVKQQETAEQDVETLRDPPGGVWISREGSRFTVGANTRNGATGCFFVIFSLFWNSIVSVFVFGPFLKPDMANDGGRFGEDAFMTLFLTPFILVGIGTAVGALFSLFGKEQVTVEGDDGWVFMGIGPLGWRRRFDTRSVRNVSVADSSIQSNDKPMRRILIEADRDVTVGWNLSESRRDFLVAVLRAELLKYRSPKT